MLFEAKFLCKGTWVTAFKGKEITNWKLHQILPYCSSGIVAGMVGSLLGLGGGFILGPFFLELGIPPQPMLMLGISTGVAFKVMFTDWMVTVVLIILFLGSRKAVGIGVQTWRWFHCKMSRYLYHTTFTGRSYRCLCMSRWLFLLFTLLRYQLRSLIRSLKLYAYAKAQG
ncbi:uncharacterized protein LOC18770869 isoform X2 [Prunus persica]|uniref:uncharacterized protein LOC18770869 isoform X2 n=1 Tax=Prunus persica TaxID=3760 RepID=UPI0009AB5029|nr:uncharacterized protein LOC18770869 isoform X2 [Prunus persica]